jgi:triacylglycerol esterase/lipase EstA (alpha/beta hydrolase family)
MRSEEALAVGDLAGDAVGGLANRIHDMHAGIAERVFNNIGTAAAPVRVIHDGIAESVYGAIGAGARALARAGAKAVGANLTQDAPALTESTRGRLAVGALNGAFGDLLARQGSPLAFPMRVRVRGAEVLPTREGLAAAFPDAGPRIAVFLHGLCETEDAWELGAARHVPYGYRLEAELGYTPLYVRYNSGLHISENGRDLAELLARVVEAWPTDVHEVALIGHSMGGLVSRSACHYGASSDWATKVRHVFTLCAPHRGAPLERATNVASSALAALPETRGFAKALNVRSAGIKDLRFGYLLDEDWTGQEPDAFLRNTGREIPFLETAHHYFVCATLSRSLESRSARMIGDLLVLSPSAWAHGGRGERMRFPVEHYRHVGGANHLAVLNHPAIYDQIRCWLTAQKALPAPASAAESQRP